MALIIFRRLLFRGEDDLRSVSVPSSAHIRTLARVSLTSLDTEIALAGWCSCTPRERHSSSRKRENRRGSLLKGE